MGVLELLILYYGLPEGVHIALSLRFFISNNIATKYKALGQSNSKSDLHVTFSFCSANDNVCLEFSNKSVS